MPTVCDRAKLNFGLVLAASRSARFLFRATDLSETGLQNPLSMQAGRKIRATENHDFALGIVDVPA
jgi:hypothetical protein